MSQNTGERRDMVSGNTHLEYSPNFTIILINVYIRGLYSLNMMTHLPSSRILMIYLIVELS